MFFDGSFLHGIYSSSKSVGSSFWSIPCSFSQKQLTNFSIVTAPVGRIVINWGDFTASTVINSGQTATHTFLSCDPLVFLPVPNIIPTLEYSIYGTGWNASGQLGLGDTTNRTSFVELTGKWDSIICGAERTFALSGDKWFACGRNNFGQLGLGDTTNKTSFVELTGNWDSIICGYEHTFALSGDKWFACGQNDLGQLSLGDTTNRTSFTQITGNWDSIISEGVHSFALSGNKWFACGWNFFGQLGLGDTTNRTSFTQITGNWDSIICGYEHTFALSGNRLFACGSGLYGKLGLGDNANRSSFTQLTGNWNTASCGFGHTFALSSSNKWFVAGGAGFGEIGLGNSVLSVNTFTELTGNWDVLKCGYQHSYALSGNKLFSTGRNIYGQLGLGDTVLRTTFTELTGVWGPFFEGDYHALAVSSIPFDPDVESYINKIGNLSLASRWNLYYFVTKLKEANIWDSIVDGWLLPAQYNKGHGTLVYALKNSKNNGVITAGGNGVTPTWEQKGIRFYNDNATNNLGPRIVVPSWTGTSLTGPVSIVSVFSPFERKSTGSCVFGKTSFGQTAGESHFGINFGFQAGAIDTYHGLNGVTGTLFPGVSTTENLYWMTGLKTNGFTVNSFLNGYTAPIPQTFTTGTLVSAIGFSYDVTGRVLDREFIGIINSGFVFSSDVEMNTFWEIFRGTIGRDLSFVEYPIYY